MTRPTKIILGSLSFNANYSAYIFSTNTSKMKQSHLNSFFKSSASVPVRSDGRDQQQSVQKQKSGKRDYKSYETKKRDRVWQANWLCTYSWLRYDKDTNIMYCESCREFSHLHPNKNIAMIKGKYVFYIFLLS